MAKKQPHSDKSRRAVGRRQEQEVERAQRTVARQAAGAAGGLDINALVARMRETIGGLTVERDILLVQLDQQRTQVDLLQQALVGEGPQLEAEEVEGPPEPTEEELTGKKVGDSRTK